MAVALPASVTNQQAGELLAPLRAAVAAGSLTVDAAALADFDSAALALLLEGRRLARAAGVPFAVSGAPAKLVELARLYGVDDLLSLT